MIFEQLNLVLTSIVIAVSALFIFSMLIKRNDIADIAWGLGIIAVALVSYVFGYQNDITSWLNLLVSLWGVRLAVRIFARNIKKGEDYRYKKWREEWGDWFYLRSYFQIYLLQGLLMVVIGYPFVHASVYAEDATVTFLVVLGSLVWLVGYYFEVVGDYQLDRFLKDEANKGKIMQSGLWQYTRHPNYFGEVTMWWGIWLIVLSLPFGWWAIISPLTITFLILKVSGIPMLEDKYEGNPEYEAYKAKTSIFIPLPPKETKADNIDNI